MANNSANEGQSSGGDLVYACHWSDFSTINGVFFLLIFIVSAIGNGLLLCVLAIYTNLKDVRNIFVLNLACSDLLFTVTLPFWAVNHLHHWVFRDFVCKFVTAAYFAGLYSSVIILTAMTVDRFMTVVLRNWPSNCVRRKRCAIGACIAAWIISVAACLSDAIKTKVENVFGTSDCVPPDEPDVELGYYLQVSLLFFLPFAIVIFCYSAILKTVLQASNRKRYRTVVVVLCIVAAFFICWGPYNILLFIMALYTPEGCKAQERLDVTLNVSRILAYSHCCMNPLLYMLSQELRGYLLRLLHCENVCRKNGGRGNGQNTSVIQNVAFTAQNSAVMLEMHNE
ncbi:chemokine XC receptor 1-like [Brachyistius frenatus]|uniref:chemokine XC receptor 1-like n=1 Tax=Brachyistius frenatus TaxID=100188 RepID=UPI0037E89AD3